MKTLTSLVLAVLVALSGATVASAQNFTSVAVGDGSASAPSVTFFNDTDTGFFRKSANTIGIAAGGAEIGTIGAAGLSMTAGNIIINQSTGLFSVSSSSYSGAGSTQAVSGDLNLAAAAGSSTALDTQYLAGVMGNLIGTAALTKTRNNMAGVWGKYTLTGGNSSVLAKAGVVGECAATSCDAAIVAVVSDGDGTTTVAPRAFYSVDWQTGSFPNSRPDFGLDLLGPGQRGEYDAGTYGKCDIRLSGNAYICTTAVVPVSGAAGTLAGTAVHGSLLISLADDKLYINTSTLAAPVWTKVGSQ